ncbi:MAG: hypothetical protein M9958_05945 [Chitinophagales bacterium]|nr:hypothetical protein [Chitinophagales bacterium]
MKHTIFIITIIAQLASCGQNADIENIAEATEPVAVVERNVVTEEVIPVPEPIKEESPQSKVEEPKLDLPFVGKKEFETMPGISGRGTPQKYIEIMNNGDVYFGFVQENQADNSITKERYYSGKFTTYMKSVFKKWGNEVNYYKITKDKIYEVDKNNKQLTGMECCRYYDNVDLEEECLCVDKFD